MHRFRSRVSVLLLVFIAASVAPVFFFDNSNKANSEMFLGYGILGVTIGFVTFMLFAMRYEVGENFLIIKLGPINLNRIKLSDIQKVERSYNPLSSPASSLKRLLIKADGKEVLISPANEREFARLLKARNPNIQVSIMDGEGWWRFWDWDV